jgi:hypothetical protein
MTGRAVAHVHPPARVSARNARTRPLHKHTRTPAGMADEHNPATTGTATRNGPPLRPNIS